MTISTNTTDDLQLVFQNLKSKARITSRTSVKERIDKLKKLVFKIKNQTLETDNRIRFGWNY